MKPTARLSLLVLVITAVCCADGGEARYRWGGSLDTTGFVPVVRNPSLPVAPPGDVSVRQSWVVDPHQLDTKGFWENPVQVRVVGSSVAVLDAPAHKIHMVSLDGHWTGSFGREGEGPGELERPVSILHIADSIVVVDGGKGTLEVFRPGGAYVKSVFFGRMTFGGIRLGTDRVLFLGMLENEGGWTVCGLDGSLSSIEIEAPVFSPFQEECRTFGWATESFFGLSCSVPAVQEYDENGSIAREILIDREPESTPEAELEQHLDEVRRVMSQSGMPLEMIQRQVESQREIYRVRRKYKAIRFDEVTRLLAVLEQNPDDLGSGNATIHLLSGSGVFLATVPFERSWIDFDFADGRLYALTRDPATDLASLSAFDLVLPEGLLDAVARAVRESVRLR
jgi:hypothetical protein